MSRDFEMFQTIEFNNRKSRLTGELRVMLSHVVEVVLLGIGLFLTASATSWFDVPHRSDPQISVTVMQGANANVNEVIQSQLQNMFAHERAQYRNHAMMKEEKDNNERRTVFFLYFSVLCVAITIHLFALLRRRQLAAMKKSRTKKHDTKMMMTSSPSLTTANELEEDDEKDDEQSLWGMLLKDKIFEAEN